VTSYLGVCVTCVAIQSCILVCVHVRVCGVCFSVSVCRVCCVWVCVCAGVGCMFRVCVRVRVCLRRVWGVNGLNLVCVLVVYSCVRAGACVWCVFQCVCVHVCVVCAVWVCVCARRC
jgi:hypothetical protein